MTRQLVRHCPRCNSVLLVKVLEPGQNTRLQAVNGSCVRCSCRLAWIVIKGNRPASPRLRYRLRRRLVSLFANNA